MSRPIGRVCALTGIASLCGWTLVACGPAEASYEGNTTKANQHAGGDEFSPSPDDSDPDGDSEGDTSVSPGPPTPAEPDAGSEVEPPPPSNQDAGLGLVPPPPAPGVDESDAGSPYEVPPPPGSDAGGTEFCNPERCDGVDNDCDGEVDEGLLNACGRCGALPAETCDNQDNDCDGQIDEGVRNACGRCGPLPAETCDGADNDCDGQVDEGLLNRCGECGALPAETCDGADNDCDGQVDEGLLNRCGECGALPAEHCNNGVDDDCDGQTDCSDTECGGDCVVTCEETEGHHCNTDGGYGNRCAPSDNVFGCSAEYFWAWCNRRNPTTPTLWDDYLRGWVAERCDNSILLLDLDNNNYDEFACTSDEGVLYRCTTPLVIALDPAQPVQYMHAAGVASFDLSAAGDGSAVVTAWPTAATPWLALDRDGDGRITSGRELFGSATLTSTGLARHGFEALAELDQNHDGRVDAADPLFTSLRVWSDDDGDRISAAHELLPLEWLGLRALDLQVQVQPRCDGLGNCERERARLDYLDADGVARQGALVDVHLRIDDAAPGLCL